MHKPRMALYDLKICKLKFSNVGEGNEEYIDFDLHDSICHTFVINSNSICSWRAGINQTK